MSKRLVKLLPVAAALAVSGLATAGSPRQLPTVVVKYGDLNLNSIDGVAKLHGRLRGAAQLVCSQLDNRVLGLREKYEECVSDAMRRSVADVDSPKLTAFHRYGRKVSTVASN